MLGVQQAAEPFILFEIAGATYGVRSRAVQQMEMIEHVTAMPNAPAYIDGIVFSRGQVIPALNLRTRFGFDKIPYDMRARLIVVHANGRTVGLIADTAREFIAIPDEAIQPPPESLIEMNGTYLEGIAHIGDRLILILDLAHVLNAVEPTLPARQGM